MAEGASFIFWFPAAPNPGFWTEVFMNTDEFECI